MKALDPKMVRRLDAITGEKAVSKYGPKGKNGVVLISTLNNELRADIDKTLFDVITVIGKPGSNLKQDNGSREDIL